MSLSDPIGDMLSRIRNAQIRNQKVVTIAKAQNIDNTTTANIYSGDTTINIVGFFQIKMDI